MVVGGMCGDCVGGCCVALDVLESADVDRDEDGAVAVGIVFLKFLKELKL